MNGGLNNVRLHSSTFRVSSANKTRIPFECKVRPEGKQTNRRGREADAGVSWAGSAVRCVVKTCGLYALALHM